MGCRRRGAWSDEPTPWSFLRGNALMLAIGEKVCIETPAGELEAFVKGRQLLQFRGGPWSEHWQEDFLDLWCLLYHYGGQDLEPNIIILQENKGQLTVRHFGVVGIDSEARAEAIIAEFQADPPGRISKRGGRAMRTCRYCPVRTRCNAEDRLHNDTQDWSPQYREALG